MILLLCTLNLLPYTLSLLPYTFNPIPCAFNLIPYTFNPIPCASNPIPPNFQSPDTDNESLILFLDTEAGFLKIKSTEFLNYSLFNFHYSL
jgi:hypothetical protein